MSERPDGVVLLHALARTPGAMEPLAEHLRAHGFAVLNAGYASRRGDPMTAARGLAAEIAAFAEQVGQVHFVGHSLGGLIARACIAQARPRRLGRVVTIGTPHGGSEVAGLIAGWAPFRAFYGPALGELTCAASAALNERLGPIDYPLGSIAGKRALNWLAARYVLPKPNDGAVSVAATRIAGMTDHRVVDCDHFFLPRDRQVLALCGQYLMDGRFPGS